MSTIAQSPGKYFPSSRERKTSPKFFRPKFFVDVCAACPCQNTFFSGFGGLTEVFGRMSAGTSGRKLPLWADFSFLIKWLCAFFIATIQRSAWDGVRVHFILCFSRAGLSTKQDTLERYSDNPLNHIQSNSEPHLDKELAPARALRPLLSQVRAHWK